MTQSVLFLCTGNSARSQMAEGLLRNFGNDHGDRFEAFSAGTRPTVLRPEAVAVMRELGIDISTQHSKHPDAFGNRAFDYVVTVCDNAKESCPVYPASTRAIHKSFMDPAEVAGTEEERLAAFRRVRDELREYLRTFPS